MRISDWSSDVCSSDLRSLYVQLFGERAGKYADAATGEHGDLLDLIAANRGLDFRAACDEARAFLHLPMQRSDPAPPGTSDAAMRLFAASGPSPGQLAAASFLQRCLPLPAEFSALQLPT